MPNPTDGTFRSQIAGLSSITSISMTHAGGACSSVSVRTFPFRLASASINITGLPIGWGGQGLGFSNAGNHFRKFWKTEPLQQIADSLDPRDLISCGQNGSHASPPFFTEKERAEAGCQH